MKVSRQSEKVGSQPAPKRPRREQHSKEQTDVGERTSTDAPPVGPRVCVRRDRRLVQEVEGNVGQDFRTIS